MDRPHLLVAPFCTGGKCTCSGPHSWAGLQRSQNPEPLSIWKVSWFPLSAFLAFSPQLGTKTRGEKAGIPRSRNSKIRCPEAGSGMKS